MPFLKKYTWACILCLSQGECLSLGTTTKGARHHNEGTEDDWPKLTQHGDTSNALNYNTREDGRDGRDGRDLGHGPVGDDQLRHLQAQCLLMHLY
jgi:hypothetical protein